MIADEAQDLGPSELRFLLSLTAEEPDRLLLAIDEGQRIYQTGFPLKALGLNFQGRSARLKLNYRTSRQIRAFADRMLPGTLRDADEETESRLGLSRFTGPKPELFQAKSPEEKIQRVGAWLSERLKDGLKATELAVFIRHDPETTAQKLQALTGQVMRLAGVPDAELPVGSASLPCTTPKGWNSGRSPS